MSIWEAIVLGLVQGVTEFLPVSSSGHLVIVGALLGVQEESLTFEVMVHFGTSSQCSSYLRTIGGRFPWARWDTRSIVSGEEAIRCAGCRQFAHRSRGFALKDSVEASFLRRDLLERCSLSPAHLGRNKLLAERARASPGTPGPGASTSTMSAPLTPCGSAWAKPWPSCRAFPVPARLWRQGWPGDLIGQALLALRFCSRFQRSWVLLPSTPRCPGNGFGRRHPPVGRRRDGRDQRLRLDRTLFAVSK